MEMSFACGGRKNPVIQKKRIFIVFHFEVNLSLSDFFSRFDDPKEKQNKKCNIFAIKIMIMENLNLISFFFGQNLKGLVVIIIMVVALSANLLLHYYTIKMNE